MGLAINERATDWWPAAVEEDSGHGCLLRSETFPPELNLAAVGTRRRFRVCSLRALGDLQPDSGAVDPLDLCSVELEALRGGGGEEVGTGQLCS